MLNGVLFCMLAATAFQKHKNIFFLFRTDHDLSVKCDTLQFYQSEKGLNSRDDLLSPAVSTQHTLVTISTTTASHHFKALMNTNRIGWVCVGAKGEIMFRLFRVSVSIFLVLTDRPINLIYRVSPHPLTSSTGLLF